MNQQLLTYLAYQSSVQLLFWPESAKSLPWKKKSSFLALCPVKKNTSVKNNKPVPNLKTPAKVQVKIFSCREFYLKSHTWKKGAVHVKKIEDTPLKVWLVFPRFLRATSFNKIKKGLSYLSATDAMGVFSLVNDTAPLAVPITLSFKILALKIMYPGDSIFLKM